MSHQLTQTARFFLTAPSACPYLEGKQERKLFTHLGGRRAAVVHQMLTDHGFRRSQNLIYRPTCDGCNACRSARVPVARFETRPTHRRVRRKNADLQVEVAKALASREQYELFMRYLVNRHDDGGMTQMSYEDYEFMVEDTPVDSVLVEYRLPDQSLKAGQLVAVTLTDLMADGYSMVYSFYDPALVARGLGNFMVLDHIERALGAGFGYVYLGYWVEQSPKMDYKSGFRPLEVHSEDQGWRILD